MFLYSPTMQNIGKTMHDITKILMLNIILIILVTSWEQRSYFSFNHIELSTCKIRYIAK
ncbi:hypothetical protein LPICM17_120045 [Lactococcus piscium]|nr:hypothetical protein LPICM17_120045 [Lactococcus piscium]